VTGVEYVDFRLRYVFPVTFRLAWIEREIVLSLHDQKLGLRIL
jgi:hypothetical protein